MVLLKELSVAAVPVPLSLSLGAQVAVKAACVGRGWVGWALEGRRCFDVVYASVG